MPELAKRVVLALARRSNLIQKAAVYIATNVPSAHVKDTYGYLKERFVENGAASRFDRATRSAIVSRFEAIDREVRMGTTPTDGLFLAELLLNVEAAGDVIECGCYAGG